MLRHWVLLLLALFGVATVGSQSTSKSKLWFCCGLNHCLCEKEATDNHYCQNGMWVKRDSSNPSSSSKPRMFFCCMKSNGGFSCLCDQKVAGKLLWCYNGGWYHK